jgi:hypothetical protein
MTRRHPDIGVRFIALMIFCALAGLAWLGWLVIAVISWLTRH